MGGRQIRNLSEGGVVAVAGHGKGFGFYFSVLEEPFEGCFKQTGIMVPFLTWRNYFSCCIKKLCLSCYVPLGEGETGTGRKGATKRPLQ